MLSKEMKNKIIYSCILAPSADNSQPFKFEWIGEELNIYIDKERSGKASDKMLVLSDIAIGAVIENACIQSYSINFEPFVETFPEENNELYVAKISFTKKEKNTSKEYITLSNQIPLRHTNRSFPFTGEVSNSFIEKIQEMVKDTNTNIISFRGKEEISNVLSTIEKAEELRMKSKTLHNEIFSTIHFNNEEDKEGLPISVLPVNNFEKPFFKLIKNWKWMNIFNYLGASKMIAKKSVKKPILASPCLLLITIKKNDRVSIINGGRAMQRIWLEATKKNYSIQPYAAPCVMSLNVINIEENLKHMMNEISIEMKEVTSDDFGLIFLRIGKSKKPCNNKTGRRPLDSFRYKKN